MQHALEYDRPELAEFGDAVFQAVSELCSNGRQHGGEALGLGVFLAARVRRDPRRQLDIAIGDWGVGIPEHIRNAYPEWLDDDFAIAQALQPGVSGTGDGHRGYGFHHTFEAALTSALHASRIEVHSGGGFVRREVVQETVSYQTFPPPRRRRGTLLCLSLTSVS